MLSDSMKETIMRSPEWKQLNGVEQSAQNGNSGHMQDAPPPSGPNDYGQQANGY
jgi:hypothetical protein